MGRYRNITRRDEDANRTHGWLVTLQRWNEISNKMFSDSVYGGKRKSLKAAVAYRDEVLAENPSYEHQLWVRNRIRKNNKSRIPGVGRYERPVNPNTGHQQVYWVASWVDEYGVGRSRKFSVSIYGESHAEQLAVAERMTHLKRVCRIKAGDQ